MLKKSIAMCLMVVCILTLFSGCRTSAYYEAREIESVISESIGYEIVVDDDYTDRKTEYGYTDRVWNAKFKEYPDITFEIIVVDYKDTDRGENRLVSLNDMAVGKYYFKYFAEKNDVIGLSIEDSSGYQEMFSLSGTANTVDEIMSLSKKMNTIEDYFKDQDIKFTRSYVIYVGSDNDSAKQKEVRVGADNMDMLETYAIMTLSELY